jgi:hypothetical protein
MKLQTRRWLANLAAFAMAMAALVLAHFPPATSSFYPRCPVYFWLHLSCPGCGGTRALAALLHGRLLEAMQFNTAIVFFLPLALGFFALTYWRAMKPGPFAWPAVPDSWLTFSLVAMAIFTVVRNLPIF